MLRGSAVWGSASHISMQGVVADKCNRIHTVTRGKSAQCDCVACCIAVHAY
jgi:hypothetical protein